MVDIFKVGFHVAGAHCFVADIDGHIIGGAMMEIRDGVAALAGASTLPAYRRRGAQRALLDYRLRYAVDHGCKLAIVSILLGSGWQRNAERNDFRVAYTRTKWARHWS